MQEDANAVAKAFKRIEEMSSRDLESEEDVKIKVVLPIMRTLGYDDSDFHYEGRTGRGYVDVVVDHFPTGVVVELKAPGKKLDNHRTQLETYVFHKHKEDRATVAILTNGEEFHVYGVTGAFYRGSLEDRRLLSFMRSDLASSALMSKLFALLGKQSNQGGAISDAIARYRKVRERAETIESELRHLRADHKRIDTRIHELENEQVAMHSLLDRSIDKSKPASTPSRGYIRKASPHILRLLREKQAFSEAQGVHRRWLDEQLINNVAGVQNGKAVSWGIIELADKEEVDHEGGKKHQGGKKTAPPIGKVWLLESHDKSVA